MLATFTILVLSMILNCNMEKHIEVFKRVGAGRKKGYFLYLLLFSVCLAFHESLIMLSLSCVPPEFVVCLASERRWFYCVCQHLIFHVLVMFTSLICFMLAPSHVLVVICCHPQRTL